MDFLQPVGQLATILHRGRQRQQLNLGRAVNNRLFPHGSPLAIVHVVAFVEDDGFHLLQGGARFANAGAVEHVAKYFGGHHHHGGVAVDGEIAGQQPDIFVAKLLAKIAQLLVGERLQRSGIKHPLAVGDRPVDGVFAYQGFAGAGGGAHHHRPIGIKSIYRLALKIVEGEGKELGEV